jgi:glycerophosphoryl diester phosphodiesterase
LAPENTLVAFRLAHERYRTDMLELDVHLSRDGALLVAHDATLERCTNGEGLLADHSAAELRVLDAGYCFTPDGLRFPFRGTGVQIPLLEEVLEAFPSVRINLELKTAAPGAPELLARALRRAGAVGRVMCGSEQDAVSAALQAQLPEAAHYFPREALTRWVLAVRAGQVPAGDARYAALDVPLEHAGVRLVDAALLAAAREQGIWVNVWTVDAPEEMRALVRLGVGGIMTDRPDLLRAVLDEAGLRPI